MENIFVTLAKKRILHTDHFLLRPFSLDDAKDMLEMTSDLETMKYLHAPHISISDSEKYIVDRFLKNPLGQYAIEEKSSKKMIGSIGFNRINEKTRTAEVGYFINKKLWNKGYMTEILRNFVELAFEGIEFNQIIAVHDKRNQASAKVILKVGFNYFYEDSYSDKDILNPENFVTNLFYRMTKKDYSGE